jgi:hypothetical protein
LDCTPDRYGPLHPAPRWRDGNKGGRQVTAEATKRVTAMATRVTSNDNCDGNSGKSDGDGNEGGGQVTTRALAAEIIVAGNSEGNCNGNEGGK